jgi:putative inorganic carbon (HCO3(-)) transporter
MILAWLVKKILDRRPVHTYLNIPIFSYIIAIFLSVIFSSNLSLSLKAFYTKTMEYILLYFIIAEFVSDRRRLRNTVIVLLVSATMVAADCIFQYMFNCDFLRFRPLQVRRITGSFQMPTDLAGYLGPVFCLFLSLSFLKLRRWLKYGLRIISIILLGLLIAALVRGAWLGLIIAICFLGLLENKKIIYIAAAFLLVFTVLLPLIVEMPDNIFTRLKSIALLSDSSSLDRKAIWAVAIRMVKARPFFGHGLSTFMQNFPAYGPDYYYLKHGIIPYAHNCYLQIAAESGIVGLLSFLTLIGAFFTHTILSLKKIKDRFRHTALSGVSAGIIVTLVHSAFDTNLYSLQLSVLFWIMLGINAALQKDIA